MGIKMTPSYDNLFMETGTQSANEITLLGLSRGYFQTDKTVSTIFRPLATHTNSLKWWKYLISRTRS